MKTVNLTTTKESSGVENKRTTKYMRIPSYSDIRCDPVQILHH